MSDETLKQLIAKWRDKAAQVDSFHATMAIGWKTCASELESALLEPAGTPPPLVEGYIDPVTGHHVGNCRCPACLAIDAADEAAEGEPAGTQDGRLTVETAARQVLTAFEESEALGYRSRDRQFAIELLRKAFEGKAGSPSLREGQK